MPDSPGGDLALKTGARVGSYEVLGPLGAGGMGEVYRARDVRLNREVALKLLPGAHAAAPDRVARFEREARAASALNHPNLPTIFEVGSSDATPYIAMELVEGETLRASLFEGPLPARRILQIGVQIAEGLSRAHGSGIVHRDLKPENVMVTKDGRVKILDFGLAKLTQPDSSAGDPAEAPPAQEVTRDGIILGTAGYMSPEQAKGGSVDYRSDQFSLGSILYEMATGRPPFRRDSVPQTLTAVIEDEPEPIGALNPKVPAPLRWTVQRCLAKEAHGRYASTEDLARELRTIHDNLSEAAVAPGVLPASLAIPRRGWRIPASIAAVILFGLGLAGWRLRESDYFWKNPLEGARFTRLTDWEGTEFDAAISSDGKFVAFVSDRDGRFDAWLAQVGSNQVLNLTKGRTAVARGDRNHNLGFSGDDSQVWLEVLGEPGRGPGSDVWLLPTIGGTPRLFLPEAISVAFSRDRTRLVYNAGERAEALFVAGRNGSDKRRIFLGEPGVSNTYPVWSPDGRFIYFARGLTTPFDQDIWRIAAAGGEPERLTNHHARVAYPTFLDDRTLLYAGPRPDGSGSMLYAIDVDRRIPHAVTLGVEEYVSVAASADGRRLVSTVANPTRQLWTAPITDHVVDEGEMRRVPFSATQAAAPRFGPSQILFLSSTGGAEGLWRFKGGVTTELWRGSDGAVAAAPGVSPDGAWIAFLVREKGRGQLYLMASDGTGSRRVAEGLDVRDTPSWSSDGRRIAVVASEGQEQPLFVVPVDGGAPVRLVGGVNTNPAWSPDGKIVAYAERGGRGWSRLKAITPDGRPFPVPEVQVPMVSGFRFLPGGGSLVLGRNSAGLDFGFWSLDLSTGDTRQLVRLPSADAIGIRSFDVSPDGKQILFDRYRENSDIVLIELPAR